MYIHNEKNDISDYPAKAYLQINSCGFQNIFSEYKVMRKNGRGDYHILLINAGEGTAIHNGREYTLKRGSLVIYAPGETQEYTFCTDSISLWMHVTGTAIDEILGMAGVKSGVYALNFNKTVFETYSNLIHRFNSPEQKKFANASFIELISYISDAIHRPEAGGNYESFAHVLTYIQMNYNKHLTVDELAKMSGYSKSRFSHLFSEAMGTTPMRYQHDIRLSNSCEMLCQTDLSITEISYMCGFEDALYFSRKFRKKYGISPSEYRNSMLN